MPLALILSSYVAAARIGGGAQQYALAPFGVDPVLILRPSNPNYATAANYLRAMDAANPGGLGGTYAGNPLGIAAANAVLDVIEEEDLCARANELGSRLKQRLEAIRATAPEIVDIRGPGFMVAVEFANPGTKEPDAGFTNRVRLEALKRGLLLLTCGVYGNVVRFLAPITIPDAHFAEAMDILEASIAAARQG